jgi:protein-tyrosine phosphatase
VFHCAAGKDRTGVVAALVLDILGVDPEVIVADYMITKERMPLILDRYRADPAFAERMAAVPASRFGLEAGTMEGFLTGLRSRYGGAKAWAVAAGVPSEALDQMAGHLLEPAD